MMLSRAETESDTKIDELYVDRDQFRNFVNDYSAVTVLNLAQSTGSDCAIGLRWQVVLLLS